MILAAVWACAWWVGCSWCERLGVADAVSRWVLSCILPTARLIAAVHTVALPAMVCSAPWVTPESTSGVFLLLVWGVTRYVGRLADPARRALAPGSPSGTGLARIRAAPRAVVDRPWICLTIVAAMYAIFLIDALTRFPTGYDALHYHFPSAIRWMQVRSLDPPDPYLYGMLPENGMIVPFLLAFARLEVLFNLVHLPKALLVAGCVYSLAHALGAHRHSSLLGVCVALSVPIVVFQSFSGYVDLYATASWMSALLALVWASRALEAEKRRDLLILAGLSAGVALGAKTVFVAWTVPLLLLAGGIGWLQRPGRAGAMRGGKPDRSRDESRFPNGAKSPYRMESRSAWRGVSVFTIALLACSSFWFIRSGMRTGNPLYPHKVSIGGATLLPGITPDTLFPNRTLTTRLERWWNYPWTETKYSGTGYPYSVNNGFGAAYTAVVPVGLIAVGWMLARRRRSIPSGPVWWRTRWLCVLTVFVLAGVVMLPVVFREMLRFVLPAVLLAVPLAVFGMDRALRRSPRTSFALVATACAVTAAVASVQPARAFVHRVRHEQWNRAAFYGVPAVIDWLPPGSRVVNASNPMLNYPLLGRRLCNVVLHPKPFDSLLGGHPLTVEWLRRHHIDYMFVRGVEPPGWCAEFPVTPIYDDRVPGGPEERRHDRLYRVDAIPGIANGTAPSRLTGLQASGERPAGRVVSLKSQRQSAAPPPIKV